MAAPPKKLATPKKLILAIHSGYKANHGIKKSCEITEDQYAVGTDLKGIQGQIEAASKEGMVNGHVYATARVPSIEVFAMLNNGTTSKRVDLIIDHGSMDYRDGTDADELIDLTYKLCGEEREPTKGGTPVPAP